MDHLIHALATLWVYGHREQYLQQISAEDAELARAEAEESDAAIRMVLQRRRRVLLDEMRALSSPLRWSSFSLKAPAPAMQTENMTPTPESIFAEAA